ncbi:hypothetical protein CSKR_109240, partial [Clonorchis sinensis]
AGAISAGQLGDHIRPNTFTDVNPTFQDRLCARTCKTPEAYDRQHVQLYNKSLDIKVYFESWICQEAPLQSSNKHLRNEDALLVRAISGPILADILMAKLEGATLNTLGCLALVFAIGCILMVDSMKGRVRCSAQCWEQLPKCKQRCKVIRMSERACNEQCQGQVTACIRDDCGVSEYVDTAEEHSKYA